MPQSLSLVCEETRILLAAGLSRTVAAQPDRFVPAPREELLARLTAATVAGSVAASRAGVRVARAGGTRKAQKAAAAKARQAHDRRATELGYPDMDTLLYTTASLTVTALADLLEYRKSTVQSLRHTRHIRSTARETTAARKQQALDAATAEIATLPAGVQPTRPDGKRQCRLCTAWLSSLVPHLHTRHATTSQQYRQRFGLPASIKLSPALEPDPAEARRRRSAAAETRLASRDQAWVMLDRRARGHGFIGLADLLQQLWRQRPKADIAAMLQLSTGQLHALFRQYPDLPPVHDRLWRRTAANQKAQQLGYTDLATLFAATTHMLARDLATLLEVPVSTVESWRHLYRTASTSKQHRQQLHQDQQAAMRAHLEGLPPGVQPVAPEGKQCRLCGSVHRGLSVHLAKTHRLTPDAYRAKFGLADTVELDPSDFRQRIGRTGAATRAAKRGRIRSDLDIRAQQHGYPNLIELLHATWHQPRAEVASLVGLTASLLKGMYRYHHDLPHRPALGARSRDLDRPTSPVSTVMRGLARPSRDVHA